MKKSTFLALMAALIATACGSSHQSKMETEETPAAYKNLPGDSTRYGLACDGCTDSTLVFLPYTGGDPDTFDIINARHEHRIYGRTHIGDELAIIVNPQDTAEVLSVINLEELRGDWCYLVSPTLRHTDSLPERLQRHALGAIPDSVRQQLTAPREYQLRLKRDHSVMAIGATHRHSTDNRSPVSYPKVRPYNEWRIWNGRLILQQPDTLSKAAPDTADILLLMRDTLVLRFADHEQGYYKRMKE